MSCHRRFSSSLSLACLSLGALLLLAAGPRQAAAQNLLINGDFSDIGMITLNNGYAALGNGGLPGWTTQVGNAANANVYVAAANSGANWIPNPQSGPYAIQLDSTSNDPLGSRPSSIQQTVTVTAGQSYLLSYWFTTEVKANLTSILQTTLSGAFNNASTHSTTAPANITQSNAVWIHVTQTFTATTNSLTINFADISTSDSNASIDNISLTVVPDPAACAAGALALGYLGLQLRQRRRARQAAA